MSDEPTSGPQDELFVNNDATTSSPSDAPQYSSRRELKHASSVEVRPRGVQRAARPAKETRAQRVLARKLAATERRTTTAPQAPRASRTSRSQKQRPFVVLLTLIAVPGFIATTTIPAFAFDLAGAKHQGEMSKTIEQADALASPTQGVEVSNDLAATAIKRDAISATTVEELAEQKATAQAIIAASTFTAATTSSDGEFSTVSGERAAGDDYPWPTAGNTLSPLNYYYRQCVDFVAWRLNRDAGSTSAPFKYNWSNLTPNGGNASEWRAAWQAHGWKTSTKPVVGAVAWFNGNHVAYVKSISGSNVTIEEYNGMVSLGYAIRTIPTNSIPTYLYPPPR